MSNTQTLFFVYNANSGLLNSALDSMHKLFSPATYNCHLCAITHGYFGAKKEWETGVKQLNYAVEYFHKNEWIELYPQFKNKKERQFPSVYVCSNGGIKEVLSAAKLEGMSLLELINELKNLKQLN